MSDLLSDSASNIVIRDDPRKGVVIEGDRSLSPPPYPVHILGNIPRNTSCPRPPPSVLNLKRLESGKS